MNSYQKQKETIKRLKEDINRWKEIYERDIKDLHLNVLDREQRHKMMLDRFAELDSRPRDGLLCGGRACPDYFPEDEKKAIMDDYSRGEFTDSLDFGQL